MKPKIKLSAVAGLLLTATISTPVSAHDPEVTPFAMAVIRNDAYGAKVSSGKYKQAIDRITRSGRRSPDGFAEQVNLCVAYVKTKEIDKAQSACDAAITQAQTQESRLTKYGRSPEARAYRTDLALALSNRGVLMAATGNYGIAEQDFRAAIELRTKLTSLVVNNLERLDSQTSS